MKIPNFDPPNFLPPNFTYILKALVAHYPFTKFREILSKCVGARGHKAETQNCARCALRAQFWPLGVVTCMACVPYQGASTLKVWGLCDLPFAAYPKCIRMVCQIPTTSWRWWHPYRQVEMSIVCLRGKLARRPDIMKPQPYVCDTS